MHLRTCLFVLLCIEVVSGVPIQAQEINLEKDLVARYLFEGNARNEVEDRNHGIETNVHYAPDRHGQANQALYLTGDNSFVTIPHAEDLNWDARFESYSILFWVKSINPRQGIYTGVRVISKWSEYTTDPYPFSFPSGDSGMHACIREVQIPPLLCTFDNIWDDQWHHATMVFNHLLQQMSIYYDGMLYSTCSKQFQSTTLNNLDILIGKTVTINSFFKGYLDDLYFFDRALNPCEVEALYSGDLLLER
jgi:hypothetical protein